MSEEIIKPLIVSAVGPLMNKVKTAVQYPKKNKVLAETLASTFQVIAEQIVPQFMARNSSSYNEVNQMHNLCYLLAGKTQQVFTSRIIHTCIDQNWDLKGLKQVLVRMFKTLGLTGYDGVTAAIDSQIKSQNLQSQSCIKAIGSFIRNPKKNINEDDLANPISTYETDFEFIKEDIVKYRDQKIKHECFSVLHPWAYDLDQVDFKYIMNNDLSAKVCQHLRTQNAQVFWLSWFKSASAVAADEFFGAIRELAEINKVGEFYQHSIAAYQQSARAADFVFNICAHAEQIAINVQQVVDAGHSLGFNALRDQIKTYTDDFAGCNHITGMADFTIDSTPKLACFVTDKDLSSMRLRELTPGELEMKSDLQRRSFESIPNKAATHKLHLKFDAVDTEELKNLEISVDGTQGVYKIGEGEANHYQIPNDKKLWESQLMIVCKDGKYFIRDLGVVHTSRIKVDKLTEIQIQQDSLVDLGKVVHYHFDKVTHFGAPHQAPSPSFYVMRPNDQNYRVENDADADPPTLRARPTWVSSDENKDLIQKEIILEADSMANFTIGRSMKREVQIKLKAVSADHCNVNYSKDKGWCISERGKDKLSSNGTFVFMKSHNQMSEHEPSDLIPLHDGMIISFINYELKISLEKKDLEQVGQEERELAHQRDILSSTLKPEPVPQAIEEVKEEPVMEAPMETPATESHDEPQKEEAAEEAQAEAPADNAPEEEESAPVEEHHSEEAPKEEAAEEAQAEAPAEEAPKEEEPAAEEPKAEEPAQAEPEVEAPKEEAAPEEAPKEEEAKVEESAPAEEAPAEEAPKEEEPKAEEPAAEEPKAEEPVAEEPAQAEPEAEAPKEEEAAVEEAPKVEESAPVQEEAPKEEAQAEAEAPAEEAPKEEEAKAEEPKAEEPVAEEPAAEEPKAEEPAVQAEEAPKEEVKAEEPAQEAPKEEVAVAEEPKAEEPKAEEAEAPKEEAPATTE